MGSVTDLVYNVRSDIKRNCSAETLKEYDAAIENICAWEAEDRAIKRINLLWSFNLSLALWVAAFLVGLWVGCSVF